MPKCRYKDETEGQRARRLSQDRERHRSRRANESEEQRSQRLSNQRERADLRRDIESQEQRSQRLLDERERADLRRANESQEQRSQRLSQRRAYYQEIIASETITERAQKRAKIAESVHAYRYAAPQRIYADHADEGDALEGVEFDPDDEEWIEYVANREQCIAEGIALPAPHRLEQRNIAGNPEHNPSVPIWNDVHNGAQISCFAAANEPVQDQLSPGNIDASQAGPRGRPRLRCNIRRRAGLLKVALQTNDEFVELNVEEIALGDMSSICAFCGSKNFAAERPPDGKFTACCHKGRVHLDPLPVSDLIKRLLTRDHPDYANFMENIRQYNSALAFASMGAQMKPPPGYGPYCYRIHGQIYHRASNLLPQVGAPRKYAQIYILDSDAAFAQRMSVLNNAGCLPELMRALGDHISQINPLAHAYKMLREVEMEEEAKALGEGRTMNKVFMGIHNDRKQDQRRYNAARANEIAIVFTSTDGAPPFERDIQVYNRSDSSTTPISVLHDKLDAMTYPILFPFGTAGWTTDRKYVNARNRGVNMTQLEYYAYRMAIRDEFSSIWNAGKLTQQYCVDSYVKIEANRLNYVRQNQKQLRVENCKGLNDYLNNAALGDNTRIGKALILPSTFQGSPRNMNQNYQDTMAIVTRYGKPDVFMTMTCNPKWKEITQNLLPYQRPEDRPDLVTRVFRLKLNTFMNDVTKNNVLGVCVAKVYVIEFQKRGLPHAHILIILAKDDKPYSVDIVDKMVSAEIPDPTTHPRLYQLVMKHMIHGPCGAINLNSPCMVDGKCSKKFPKAFAESTNAEVNGYPVYKRRNDSKSTYHPQRAGCSVSNAWVVPYNPYLLLKYNCHLNVEVCASIKSVKYLFKYVYKGHDKANVKVTEKPGEAAENVPVVNFDEVQSFVDTRYVSAPEGMWRINGFKMHDMSHSIIRLALHLPNEQPVYFEEGEELDALRVAEHRDDTLTAWFKLNRDNEECRQYLYHQIPEHYVYHRKERQWRVRKRGHNTVIGRMYSISIQQGDLYYLRLLLLHVRGATSYEDVRTVDGELCSTFREAAKKRHLLEDDNEWNAALKQAATYQLPYQMRECFAYICLYGLPTDPNQLWVAHKVNLSEDFEHNFPQFSAEIHQQIALREIQEILKVNRKSLSDFQLPEVTANLPDLNVQRPINIEQEREEGVRMEALLKRNPAQKAAYDKVIRAVNDSTFNGRYFYLDGPGGSGKTFTYETVYHKLTGEGKSVLCVASTGIAATLLPGGNTHHSTFGFGVPLTESSVSHISGTSEAGRALRDADVFIWDEVTMTPHYALKAVDEKLRDLTRCERPFGGKTIILGGDFRQCLPVVKKRGRVDMTQACVKNGDLWKHFECLGLHQDMRMTDPDFQKWLLKVGNGELLNVDDLPENVLGIPPDLVENSNLVDTIFGKEILPENVADFTDTAIFTSRNDIVDQINDQVLTRLCGESKIYYSVDSVVSGEDVEVENYPVEFLNTLTTASLPKHKLVLKKGTIVMLLRNFNKVKALCNGTRFIVMEMSANVLLLKVLSGKSRDQLVFMPRILLESQPGEFPFILRRRQFPIRLAFAMTINKSQGQSLNKVGIYLPEPVFAHGQLYVALTRARTRSGIKIKIFNTSQQGNLIPGSNKVFTLNVVYREVFDM